MLPDAQRGSLLPAAVFLVVVIAVLAAVLLRLTAGGSSAVAYETLSTRAHLAARSGVEWGGMQVAADQDCGTVDGATLDLSAEPGMEGCSATLACGAQDVDSASLIVFTLTSSGTCQAADLTTARTLEGIVEIAP